MRVGVVHNLRAGGAHRRLTEQLAHLDSEVLEVCLSTAIPITPGAIVVPYTPLAPAMPQPARPPARYFDLASLVLAWRRATGALSDGRPDVVMANPCRLLQAPAALLWLSVPTLYFCDEPREDPVALTASRNPATRRLYAPLHAAEARLDRSAAGRATRLATNSRYSAGEIHRVYGREATVLSMGIPAGFTPTFEPAGDLLSVGTLIESKGHEIVVRAAALARTRRPVVIVAPRPGPAEQARLARIADELGVELTLRVAITDDELVATYRRAFATLYMAVREPFGLASLEAQACGSPVVVSDDGGLRETLLDGVTGWAVQRDPAAVAAKLDLLDREADDRTVARDASDGHDEGGGLRAAMSRAAAFHAASATWASAAEELAGLLAEVHQTGVP